MFISSAIIPLIAATTVASSPAIAQRQNDEAAECRTFYADITASATNLDLKSVLGGDTASQQALVEFSIERDRTGSTLSKRLASAPALNISGTYSLWFEYCAPADGTPTGVFQTSHGLVGNAGYWNVQLDNGLNSFANAAAAAGWATLSYDRLGVGRSAHPDGLDVVQSNYEIAQAVAINAAVRAGELGDIGVFDKVVGVGHSYGSLMLTGTASVAPEVFDAIILTGYSANGTSGPLGIAGLQSTLANVAYPDRFGNLSNSYLSTPSVNNDQLTFFRYPNYTQEALDKFTTVKGEYTLGQQITIANPYTFTRPNFTKPVFVITGNEDGVFCAANCTLSSIPNGTQLDTARALFPAVDNANFSTCILPDTGHGINFHPTAYEAYQKIIQFVQTQGI